MKKALVVFPFLFVLISAGISQSWTYSKGEDPFDGSYKTASIIGSSDDATYSTPQFVVNNFENSNTYNVYLSNIGYFCDNVEAMFRFDNAPTIYQCKPSATNKQKVAFLNLFWFSDENGKVVGVDKFEFLELMMKHSVLNVRISDDCDQVNMKFSLNSSTKAIKYVYGGKYALINSILKEREQTKIKEANIDQWRSEIIDGDQVLLKLGATSKYIILFEYPTFQSKHMYKMTENDTVVTGERRDNMMKVTYNDTIQGWVDMRWLHPL